MPQYLPNAMPWWALGNTAKRILDVLMSHYDIVTSRTRLPPRRTGHAERREMLGLSANEISSLSGEPIHNVRDKLFRMYKRNFVGRKRVYYKIDSWQGVKRLMPGWIWSITDTGIDYFGWYEDMASGIKPTRKLPSQAIKQLPDIEEFKEESRDLIDDVEETRKELKDLRPEEVKELKDELKKLQKIKYHDMRRRIREQKIKRLPPPSKMQDVTDEAGELQDLIEEQRKDAEGEQAPPIEEE